MATSVLEENTTASFNLEVGGDIFLRKENHLQHHRVAMQTFTKCSVQK
jgi:hypothetical protein